MGSELASGEHVLMFEDVVLDLDNFAVTKGCEPVALTPRAFDLLVLLIRKRERVVEKQELFETIWHDTFVTDNALTRAVKEIRQALGDNAAAPRYIETVHKRGYRFIASVSTGTGDKQDSKVVGAGKQTASGGRFATRPEEGQPRPRLRPVYLGTAFGGMLALLLALTFLYSGSNKKIETVAVLPFQNESGNAELEYLADGMTETLIGSLSNLRGLSVRSRLSVFQYKGTDKDVKTIGRELNVQGILTGRVVQRGDELTLYLSLVDPASDANIWSRQYNRKIANLVTLQSEITKDVADSLGNETSGPELQSEAKGGTQNVEAYQLYLKGRHHLLSTRTLAGETAVSYYRQAIAIDPNYALAYSGLAEAAITLAFRSEVPSETVFPDAKKNAFRAVELAPGLAEAHVALALITIWYDRDWATARSSLERALEFSPNNPDARLANGILLYCTGRRSEGLVELRLAVELEPLNLRNNIVEAQFLNFSGRSREALEISRNTLKLNPNFYLGHLMAATAHLEAGAFMEAETASDVSRELNPVDSLPRVLNAYAMARSGKKLEARIIVEEILDSGRQRYISPYNIALAQNAIGDSGAALLWLERALEQNDLRVIFLTGEPKWNNLRADPRFHEILMRAGLAM